MHRRSAFTLAEVLAVIVVLGSVGTIGASLLARVLRQDPLVVAAQRLQAADSQARRLALSRKVVVRYDAGGLQAEDPDAHAMLARSDFPADVTVGWFDSRGLPVQEVALDDRGRSGDVSVVLAVAGRERRIVISGLTGDWWNEDTRR